MKAKIYNLIILDKSGSMESIRKEAIDGYNETLGMIKAAQLKFLETQEHRISLTTFCDCGMDMIYDMVPVKDAEKLSKAKYEPCCGTPLYDAIGISVKKLKECVKGDKQANVVVSIITDGFENASKEWSGAAVKALIDELKEEGWMFSFIGSAYNAKELAMNISITNTMQWSNTPDGTREMFVQENDARSRHYSRLQNLSESGTGHLNEEELKAQKRKISDNYFNKKIKN